MHTKTMEGLVGARTSLNSMNVPMRIYKEARQRGDTATMERAMGYASDYASRANEYQNTAYEGMEKDAEAAREKEKLDREKAIEKRREERKKLEELAEKKNTAVDTVEISEEGKVLLEENISTDTTADTAKAETPKLEIPKTETGKEAVIYTKTRVVSHMEQKSKIVIIV